MSWANSQKQTFDESYSKALPKQTVNNCNLDIFIKSASPKVVDVVCDVDGGAGANLAALKRKIEEHARRIVRKGGSLYFGTPNKATNLYLPLIIDVHLLLRNRAR
jgi:hypothetical protein